MPKTQQMRQAKRTRWGVAIVGAVALVSAGCGDSSSEPEPLEVAAVIPAKEAEELAKRTDEVADLVAAGDTCGAARKADELQDEVEKSSGEIPPELLSELQAGAEQLVNITNCPPPPEKKPKKDKHDEDDEGDGDGGYDEEEIFGEGDGDSSPGNSGNAPGHNKGGGD